ncbi:MAG: hypothetical protein GF383_07105 [Candidatus Lokiarchaeota archaeon]|nr:hypothetical protein [Candidatus Lokiarchaeota archaeon]MBD3339929.1 hypothetical protein [Candidatus Lokiarchaeota archaeon]
MTSIHEKEFQQRLLQVVNKLVGIANTQSTRYKSKWEEYLGAINKEPYIVRRLILDKQKFIDDLKYRVDFLKHLDDAIIDGFYTIKSLLETLYRDYFDSDFSKKSFKDEEQLILKYYIAKEILGNLIQYNKMDHETVPLKYNIMARNYLLIKLSGLTDEEILENMKKLNIDVSLEKLHELMNKVENDGIIKKTVQDGGTIFYTINKEIKLSDSLKKKYNNLLRPVVEWPTQFWRSFYNLRELNVSIEDDCKFKDFLQKVLSKSAIQGFSAADFVIKNLKKYYEKILRETSE